MILAIDPNQSKAVRLAVARTGGVLADPLPFAARLYYGAHMICRRANILLADAAGLTQQDRGERKSKKEDYRQHATEEHGRRMSAAMSGKLAREQDIDELIKADLPEERSLR